MVELFNKWKQGLEKTRKVTFGRIATIFGASEIDDDTWEELEAMLIQADVGIETTDLIIDALREKTHAEGITKSAELQSLLRNDLISRLDSKSAVQLPEKPPAVILLAGVNGSGKTTSAAKLGYNFTRQGKRTLLCAADTYRAAAIDQLQVWGDRLNLAVIAGQPDADPAAVAYDAIQAAVARKFDVVIIDTAGRLHTRYNLMEELKKVYRVSGKALPGAPHDVWLVLDATTGQNALYQADAFKQAVNITGVILSKLDSSAKGGMTFAIKHKLNLPILYAGLGEKPEDLEVFDPEKFVDGILGI